MSTHQASPQTERPPQHMTWGGLYAYHVSRRMERTDYPFASLIFAAIRKADSENLARLELAFPELVSEMRRRYDMRLGALPEDQITDLDALSEQVKRLME